MLDKMEQPQTDLGPVISEHQGRIAAGGIGWYIGGLMFGASIVGVFKSLIAGAFSEVLYMLVFAIGTGLWLFWLFAKWKQSLTIYQHGFVHRRVVGAPRTVRFDEVNQVEVYRQASRQSLHTKGLHVEVTLYLRAGGTLVLSNDIADIEQLAVYAQPGGASAGGPSAGAPKSPKGQAHGVEEIRSDRRPCRRPWVR